MAVIVSGKVAIVTGAARGIGRAIALGLAQEGAKVVVCDIGASLQGAGNDAGPAQQAVDEIKKAGGEAVVSTLSIAEPKNADAIVKVALDAFGRVDILVNNAGILRDTIFHKMSWSDWTDVLDVHLNGSFNLSRACAAHFREQNSGAVCPHDVYLGAGRQFRPGQLHGGEVRHCGSVPRDCARHATLQGALELHRAIRLDFGMIDSIPATSEAEKKRVAAFQQMTPEKIAPLVTYLASDRAEGITGQIFGVRNNEVFLFSQPRPVRTLHRSGGWTPQALDEQLKGAFGPSLTPLERSSDVFSWDPV